jgi:hypothetical protein
VQREVIGRHQRERDDSAAELDCGDREHMQPEAGGEAACFAQMLCPECGVVLDGSPHSADCRLGSATTAQG